MNGKSTGLLRVVVLMKKGMIRKIIVTSGGHKMNFNDMQALSFEIKNLHDRIEIYFKYKGIR